MNTILDRYIYRELLAPFFFGIFAFSSILVGSAILPQVIKQSIIHGIPFWITLQLIFLKMPAIISYTFPMSILLASLLTFGRLNNDFEIIAFRAGGIGFSRLIRPVLVVGILVSVFTIWFNEFVVPTANTKSELIIRQVKNLDTPIIRKNINFTQYDSEGLPSRIINVPRIEEDLFKEVSIAEYDSGKLSRIILADSGKWSLEDGWAFFDGTMHIFSQTNKNQVSIIDFKKETIKINISPKNLDEASKKSLDEMNTQEIQDTISDLKRAGKDTSKAEMQLHLKFSVPFASLIFSFLGASIGIRPVRSNSATGLGISLAIILFYYVLLAIGMGLGLSGTLPAFIATWTPNIIIGFIGLTLLRRLSTQ